MQVLSVVEVSAVVAAATAPPLISSIVAIARVVAVIYELLFPTLTTVSVAIAVFTIMLIQ